MNKHCPFMHLDNCVELKKNKQTRKLNITSASDKKCLPCVFKKDKRYISPPKLSMTLFGFFWSQLTRRRLIDMQDRCSRIVCDIFEQVIT